jgi:hypothetical protein
VVGPIPIILEGNPVHTATSEITVHSENTVEAVARRVAEAVCNAAHNSPETTKKIVVKLKMSHDNLGTGTKEDQPMGQIEVTNVREVQIRYTYGKIRTDAFYESVGASYVVQIQQMKYANLLKPR